MCFRREKLLRDLLWGRNVYPTLGRKLKQFLWLLKLKNCYFLQSPLGYSVRVFMFKYGWRSSVQWVHSAVLGQVGVFDTFSKALQREESKILNSY
jgi:hypothetical protein